MRHMRKYFLLHCVNVLEYENLALKMPTVSLNQKVSRLKGQNMSYKVVKNRKFQ